METNNKLREALEATNKFLESAITEGKVTAQDITALRNIVSAARSEPVRNCDVGTAEEQWKRFDEFCDAWQESAPVESCSDKCPVIKMKNLGYDGCQGRSGCYALWAQLPYAQEGGAK